MRSHSGDLDEDESWPPHETVKEVRRLSNNDLVEITAWEQLLFDWYVRNDDHNDPISRQYLRSLRRLHAEIDRRIEAGTLREEDFGLDYVPEPPVLPQKANKRINWIDAFINYGTPVCGVLGAVLGFSMSSVPGVEGAISGALIGALVPSSIVSIAAIFGSLAYLIVRLIRPL